MEKKYNRHISLSSSSPSSTITSPRHIAHCHVASCHSRWANLLHSLVDFCRCLLLLLLLLLLFLLLFYLHGAIAVVVSQA